MATTVRLPLGEAKIRNLWLVLLLLVVTLGFYYLYWYYSINRELRDYGRHEDRRLDIDPGMSLLAITLGAFLIVPPFVSAWRTVKRVRAAERLAGIPYDDHLNHALGFVLFIVGFVLLPIEVFYVQHHLNRLWRHVLGEDERRAMGMRPTTGFGR